MIPEQGISYLFDRSSIWWKRPDLVPEGFYFKHLEKYFDHFPHENIRVYLYEDFRSKPLETLRDIFGFIGVNPEVQVDTDVIVNKSGRRKKNMFNLLLGQNGALIGLSKSVLPGIHERFKRNKNVVKYLNKARNKNIIPLKMSPEFRDRITNEIYHDDISSLSKLLNRDLEHWLAHGSISSSAS